MHKISIEKNAFDNLQWWSKENPKIVSKILDLIENTSKTPFTGLQGWENPNH